MERGAGAPDNGAAFDERAFNVKLGAAICAARLAQGLAQKALAQACVWSATFMCRIEHGKRGLRLSQLQTIADELGVTSVALLRAAR
jgi:transcriptional regulator with XRE-family HTH domain